ncbi:MAG: DNA polymerase, beta domain protein region [Halomonas sp. 54_146]|nr:MULTISPECIES: nucleotidyltransferase domain-containing protein [unclassified Halomonas]KUJ87732.1 MAG: DNA polymerase, beta domain protein region [Halomonas sp. 54_146]HAA44972.1 DNA polymerase III subunit beta [Halomonas sp.]
MRLSDYQRQKIVQSVKNCFGAQARVKLFGSRADDGRRGGDIDLLITTDMQDINDIVRAEISCQVQLQQALGEQKIDILIDYPGRAHSPPIFSIAEQSGIPL